MVIEMKPRSPERRDTRRCVETTRKRLAEAARLLQCHEPASVQECGLALEAAIAEVVLLQSAVAAGHAGNELRAQVQALRSDVARVQILIAQAADMHRAWAQILGAAAGGYTRNGAAPELAVQPQVSFNG